MKNLLLILIIFTVNAYAQQFTIVGKAACIKNGDTISINVSHTGVYGNKNTTTVKNGIFSFTLNQPGAERYILMYHKNRKDLFLASKNTEIAIVDTTLKNIIVKDNDTYNEFEVFHRLLQSDNKYTDFNSARLIWLTAAEEKKIDAVTLAKLKYRSDSLLKINKIASVAHVRAWVSANPASQINGYVFVFFATGSHNISAHMPEDELKTLYNSMPDVAKQNSWSKQVEEIINGLIVGAKAPEFQQTDINEKVIKLSDFKGKYVLLDFWASWCAPCRAENPNVSKLYQQYRDKNFTVLSVSLDDKKEFWTKAIEHDSMPWDNVSDLKGRGNIVAKKYKINAIPANFLIGPDGVIIAKNLTGGKLEKELASLFNKP